MLFAPLMNQRKIYFYGSLCLALFAMVMLLTTNKKVTPEKDGYYEMIRQTTQALSAVIGGVDSLSIIPHVAAMDKGADFQQRIARNVQLILQHESHLDSLTDPAAGSWYIESITEQLATKTWERFVASTQTS